MCKWKSEHEREARLHDVLLIELWDEEGTEQKEFGM